MENFNNLTAAETERLAILAEECAEVIQIINKIFRHGYESVNPEAIGGQHTTNRMLLEMELGDVMCAKDIMEGICDIDCAEIESRKIKKFLKISRYLHHQKGF